MPPTITPERPDTPDAVALITELDDHLGSRYPAESRHGFSVQKLIRDNVAFFVVRVNDADNAAAPLAVGCGGIMLVPRTPSDIPYAEVKRMYVRPAHRGQGLSKLMLHHLADHAAAHGFRTLRLETGIHQLEAIALYERFGFQRTGPFGPYTNDPLSLYFEKQL
ncbi:MAG TPA: N-acetyltransferase [Phycisphaerales bacterium]|nr:N-acetyltransferase [Phycisphaerales bacterium]